MLRTVKQTENKSGLPGCLRVGLAAALVVIAGVTAGVGSAAGVRVARFTAAITDTAAITSATIATVASPRRSHLADGLGAGSTFASFAATGSSVAAGGEGGDPCVASTGRGANLVDRLSAVS